MCAIWFNLTKNVTITGLFVLIRTVSLVRSMLSRSNKGCLARITSWHLQCLRNYTSGTKSSSFCLLFRLDDLNYSVVLVTFLIFQVSIGPRRRILKPGCPPYLHLQLLFDPSYGKCSIANYSEYGFRALRSTHYRTAKHRSSHCSNRSIRLYGDFGIMG